MELSEESGVNQEKREGEESKKYLSYPPVFLLCVLCDAGLGGGCLVVGVGGSVLVRDSSIFLTASLQELAAT